MPQATFTWADTKHHRPGVQPTWRVEYDTELQGLVTFIPPLGAAPFTVPAALLKALTIKSVSVLAVGAMQELTPAALQGILESMLGTG